jgi:hypothetical protein
MAIDRNKLESIINGARALCTPEGERLVNSKIGIKEETIKNTHAKSAKVDLSRVKNSKLPDSIKESLMKDPIDMDTDLTSALDDLIVQKYSTPQTRNQVVNENYTPVVNNNGIDYTIIKAIFNECLKEYFENKQPINESATLKTIGLQNGNISLIDNKGNIFKAKLEKIGNKDNL